MLFADLQFSLHEKVLEILEILTQDESDALCRQRIIDRIVALVVVAIGLDTHRSLLVQEEFKVEVSNEGIAVSCRAEMVGRIAVADVAIDQETVVKQSGAEAEVHLHVGKIALV